MAKTSVWLTEQLAADVKADGRTLSAILRAGLDAPTTEQLIRNAIRDELATQHTPPPEPPNTQANTRNCPHPASRITKGLCNACGTNVA